MERNREARRGAIPATANGLSRRRQRNSSLRDSPEEDGGALELQEIARLRDRASKKDRDRDRDRSNRSKRRRGDRLLHGSNREDGGEESTEESLDDDEEEEDEDTVASAASAVRLPSMNPMAPTMVSLMPNHHHHHQRKSYPPKVVRAAGPPWKVADEMIGVSVPRKARSGSAKRSHECWISGGGGSGEQILRQASTSPARPTTATAAPAAPISPSSSNASVRKKLKPMGAKHKPPKISKATSSSSIQEIEIEVAEVLYGMTRQFQCPSKQEQVASASHKPDSKDAGGSSNDAKSRVSSPVSASPPAGPHPYLLTQNSTSTSAVPSSAVAPKRKRPRPVKFEEESPATFADPNASTSSAAKIEEEQPERVQNSSPPKSEKNAVSIVENGGESSNLGSSQVNLQQDPVKQESDSVPDSKPLVAESDGGEGIETKDEISSPVKESPCAIVDVNLDNPTVTIEDSTACAVDCIREEKFKFDLMDPPSAKSSPERDGGAPGFVTDLKPSTPEVDVAPKMEIVKTEEAKAEGSVKQETGEVGFEEKKAEEVAEVTETQKQMPKERILDLQLEAEMQEKDNVSSSSKPQVLKQEQSKAMRIEPKVEKAALSASLPVPMPVPGWPGSLPLGYMGQVPSVQAVVSMDRTTGSSTTMQLPHFAPPKARPKRCATHFHIAKNIYCHQQFARMTPYWPTGPGSAALYGSKQYNLNAVPPTESAMLLSPLQGSFPGRNLGSLQEKGQAAALAGQASKEKSMPATFMDAAQRKQLMLQQVPQSTSTNNILQAPAFIFPMNQQQAAAAAAATRSGMGKSSATISNANPSSGAANSVVAPVASSGSSAPTNVNFNYANMPANDSQYLAILQNNGYPFPIHAPVGAPPPYRGNHAQAVPFFNGSFYTSQMLHPSQLQQQQHPPSQPPIQQGHQNTSTSSSSSSSQKHQQQQQLLQGCSSNGRGGSSQSFPALKQRQQQSQNQHLPPHQARQLESEVGGEDSPSTSDSRASHAHKNAYNHNFAIPMHPQNFTLMSPAALGGGNHSGDKQQQQQQQTVKGGMELTPSQAFAMSFASFSGTAAGSGLDFSSMAHSHPVFQSLPEAARHGFQMAAATSAPQNAQKKNHQNVEDGRTVNDSINSNASGEEDKKTMAGKASASMMPHSLVFSRPEGDPSTSTILGNSVIDTSGRTLNLISAPMNGNRASSRSASVTASMPTATTASASNFTNQQHQQIIQLQKQQQHQHQQQQAAARTKPAAANNAAVYSDRMPHSTAGKFPSAISVFPQALIQGSSPNQSPQWKNSTRTGTTPVQSPSTASMQSVKSLPQQQGRVQVQGLPSTNHTQISFGVNPKAAPSGQQLPTTNPSQPSAGIVVGSPSTSMSKGVGGSPMTSAANKVSSPAASMPSQPAKNSQPSSSRKSSPVGGRNVPSIHSNSHINPAQSSSVKPQQQQQQNQHQQPQLQKPPFQQAQLFFSNAYMQAQSPHSNANAAAGYYQRRQSEQQQLQQQQLQQQQNSAVASSGMMSVGSPSLTTPGTTATSDPAKAVAVAANNLKTLPSQNLLQAQFTTVQPGNPHPHPLMSAAYPYIHAMPAVPVKPAEQKPAADLHSCLMEYDPIISQLEDPLAILNIARRLEV